MSADNDGQEIDPTNSFDQVLQRYTAASSARTDDDDDLGDIEMFSSSAAPADNHSSSAAGTSPVTGRKSSKSKKHKHKRKPSRDTDQELTPKADSSKKHTKSKRRNSEAGRELSPIHDSNEPEAADADMVDTEQLGAVAPSTPKRKRKSSDAADTKKRRRRANSVEHTPKREREVEPDETAEADARDIEAAEALLQGTMEAPPPEEDESSELTEEQIMAMAQKAWDRQGHGPRAQTNGESSREAIGAADSSNDPTIQAVSLLADTTPRRSARAKKAKPTFFEQPPHEEDDMEENRNAYADLPSPSAAAPKPRRRAAPSQRRTKKLAQSMQGASDDEDFEGPRRRKKKPAQDYVHGRFTEEELDGLKRVIEKFRDDEGLSQPEVNAMIQAPGGTAAGEAHTRLWENIFEELPHRHRQKTINVARKNFHNFVARGTWTAEQQQEFSDLIEVHGRQWSKIAAIINRHPEDLRDRYRNYLICGDKQRKDAWTDEEEALLTQLVMHSRDQLEVFAQADPDNPVYQRPWLENMDWQIVSEQMNRQRSRLQCITKWKSMHLNLDGTRSLKSAAPDADISFPLEKARLQLSEMPDEERLRLLLAINETKVGTEAKIPWQKLVDKEFRNRWHKLTQMLLWRRLRRAVPDWETRSVRDCVENLIAGYNATGSLFEIPDEDFDVADEMEFINSVSSAAATGRSISHPPSSRARPGRGRGRGANALSDEIIQDEDAEPTASEQPAQDDDQIQIDPALSNVASLIRSMAPEANMGVSQPAAVATMEPEPAYGASPFLEPGAEDDANAGDGGDSGQEPAQEADVVPEVEDSPTKKKKSKSGKGKGKKKQAAPANDDMPPVEDDEAFA